MKKIVRISESDLVSLIKTFLFEQKVDIKTINPNNLKLGYGTKNDPNSLKNIPLVKELQKKLSKYEGCSSILGTIDGKFGKKTQSVLNQVLKNGKCGKTVDKLGNDVNQPTNKIVLPNLTLQSDTFKHYKDTAETKGKISQLQYDNFKKGIIPSIKNKLGIPIHWRAFLNFLSGKEDSFTEKDMTSEEQKTLSQMIKYLIQKKKFKDGEIVSFYDISNKLNSDEKIKFGDRSSLGIDQMDIKNITTKLAMTLGNAKIQKTNGGYLITDIYDFNCYQNHPEDYKLSEVPNTVKDSFNLISTGNYVQGIEKLASYKQSLGYKGYPISISIPEIMVKG